MPSPSHIFYIFTGEALGRIIVNQRPIVPNFTVKLTIFNFFSVINIA